MNNKIASKMYVHPQLSLGTAFCTPVVEWGAASWAVSAEYEDAP
jgi:hypothetical protein